MTLHPQNRTSLSTRHALFGLIAWLALAFVAAAIGAAGSIDASSFYAELTRPAWAPPGWIFGPVWSVLYTLMGIAAWLVWRSHRFAGARTALTLFVVQLAANALWSWLFFTWRQGALAFADVILLWCLVGATLLSFWRLNRLAALLFAPYFLWVTFASALTFAVWQMNPALQFADAVVQ